MSVFMLSSAIVGPGRPPGREPEPEVTGWVANLIRRLIMPGQASWPQNAGAAATIPERPPSGGLFDNLGTWV